MNEHLLNINMHHLKDVLLLNSLHNIISEPTRQLALLDPITLHEDMSPLNQGIIKVLPDISDHCATYVYFFEYPVHGTFTRNVLMYKNANKLFNTTISKFDWSCLHQGNVNVASSLHVFTNIFIEFVKLCISSKNNCSLRR